MSEWKEVFQESSNKYYYWNSESNNVSWTIPDTTWRKFHHATSKKAYYVNAETQQTLWKVPEGVTVPGPAEAGSSEASAPTVDAAAGDAGSPEPPMSPTAGSGPSEPSSPKPSAGDPDLDDSKDGKASPTRVGREPALSVMMSTTSTKKEFPDSENAEAIKLKLKGNDHFNSKQFKEALEAYSGAIELDNKCANFYFNRSATWFCLKDYDKALEDARKAVELAPSNTSALSRLGFSLLKTKKLEEAEEVYKQAHKLEPSNARIFKGLQRVQETMKKPKE